MIEQQQAQQAWRLTRWAIQLMPIVRLFYLLVLLLGAVAALTGRIEFSSPSLGEVHAPK